MATQSPSGQALSRVEPAQNESEARLRKIIDTIPTLAWCNLPDGSNEFLNQRWHEYTGLSPQEAHGWGWKPAIHPEDFPRLMEEWEALRDRDKPGECEVRLRRSDGAFRWFLFRREPLRDETGTVVRWYGTGIDIEDRKQTESLRAAEKRTLEMITDGASLKDILNQLCSSIDVQVSPSVTTVLLMDPDGKHLCQSAGPLVPREWVSVISPVPVAPEAGLCGTAAFLKARVIVTDVATDPNWPDEYRDLAIRNGIRAAWSEPILTKDNQVLGTFALYCSESRVPTDADLALIEGAGRIALIAIERQRSQEALRSALDEIRKSEEALRRSEAFLAEGQHLSRTGSFSWRVATDEITWSEELYRIFEFDQGVPVTLELIGTRVHPEDIPLLNDMIERARGAASDFEYEHRLQMPDHSVKYLHMIARGTRDKDGRLEYIGAVQDLTERRLSEEALSKARSELAHVARITSLGVLTASIAHEVNQPLSGIITNASTCLRMLAADPPNVDGARETARRTIRDGNRASEVITRLRALFSSKETTTESVDLNEATREVIALLLSELQRNRVILRPELADDLPPVIGDRVQLQQVILNLLRNASDAMSAVDDRPRQLEIRTEKDGGDRVRLTVQDAGVGFEPQALDRLFEAFYTTKNDGMGIGLSVSRSIIETHHGRLWAEPNNGPGATFSFSIPCASEDVKGTHSLGAVRTPAETNARHVMRNL